MYFNVKLTLTTGQIRNIGINQTYLFLLLKYADGSHSGGHVRFVEVGFCNLSWNSCGFCIIPAQYHRENPVCLVANVILIFPAISLVAWRKEFAHPPKKVTLRPSSGLHKTCTEEAKGRRICPGAHEVQELIDLAFVGYGRQLDTYTRRTQLFPPKLALHLIHRTFCCSWTPAPRILWHIRLLNAGSAGEHPCETRHVLRANHRHSLHVHLRGFVGFLDTRRPRNTPLFWVYRLKERQLFSNHSELYVSAGSSYFFISSPRFEELAGWSHPSGSNCSLSSCVGHHSQMVRNHSRLRSSVIYAQQSFMHERTVWFVSVNGWMPAGFNCLQRDKYNVDSLYSSK